MMMTTTTMRVHNAPSVHGEGSKLQHNTPSAQAQGVVGGGGCGSGGGGAAAAPDNTLLVASFGGMLSSDRANRKSFVLHSWMLECKHLKPHVLVVSFTRFVKRLGHGRIVGRADRAHCVLAEFCFRLGFRVFRTRNPGSRRLGLGGGG